MKTCILISKIKKFELTLTKKKSNFKQMAARNMIPDFEKKKIVAILNVSSYIVLSKNLE